MRDRRPGRDVFDHPYFLKRNMTNTFFSHFPPTVVQSTVSLHNESFIVFLCLARKGQEGFPAFTTMH